MRFLTHDDVATLVSAIDGRYRSLVYVAAYTGLRAGDLLARVAEPTLTAAVASIGPQSADRTRRSE